MLLVDDILVAALKKYYTEWFKNSMPFDFKNAGWSRFPRSSISLSIEGVKDHMLCGEVTACYAASQGKRKMIILDTLCTHIATGRLVDRVIMLQYDSPCSI